MKKNNMKIINLLILVLVLLFPNTAFAQSSNSAPNVMDLSVSPINNTADPKIKTYYVVQGQAGETVNEVLTLKNLTSATISSTAMVTDSLTGDNGGIVYGSKPDEAAWVTGIPQNITVPAKGEIKIPFQIQIPKNAVAGDTIYGLAFTNGDVGSVNESSQKSGIGLTLKEQVRKIVAVEIKIPGKETGNIVFSSAKLITYPAGNYIQVEGYDHQNFIDTNLNEKVIVRLNGKTIWTKNINGAELKNNAPFRFLYKFDGTPSFGKYTVQIAALKKTKTQNKSFQFSISPQKAQKTSEITGSKAPQKYVPYSIYLILSFLLLLVVALGIYIIKTRNHKKKRDRKKPE